MTRMLRERAYAHIHRLLVTGELPPGAQLSNRALARQIGTSFIPVREAISQLISEGLVEHRPDLGAFVRTPQPHELRELYDLREALECHATRRAVELLTEAELAEMTACNDRLWAIAHQVEASATKLRTPEQVHDWLLADSALHMVVLRAARNERLLKLVGELRLMSHIFFQPRVDSTLEMLCITCRDHDGLLAAFAARDVELAFTRMAAHVRRGCEHVLSRLETSVAPETAAEAALRDRLQVLESTQSAPEIDRPVDPQHRRPRGRRSPKPPE